MTIRTTIVLEEDVHKKVKKMATKRKLSPFINQCLREHFQAEERAQQLLELEKSYQRASEPSAESQTWDSLETEDWPEW